MPRTGLSPTRMALFYAGGLSRTWGAPRQAASDPMPNCKRDGNLWIRVSARSFFDEGAPTNEAGDEGDGGDEGQSHPRRDRQGQGGQGGRWPQVRTGRGSSSGGGPGKTRVGGDKVVRIWDIFEEFEAVDFTAAEQDMREKLKGPDLRRLVGRETAEKALTEATASRQTKPRTGAGFGGGPSPRQT